LCIDLTETCFKSLAAIGLAQRAFAQPLVGYSSAFVAERLMARLVSAGALTNRD
jgi:hypothetical protein